MWNKNWGEDDEDEGPVGGSKGTRTCQDLRQGRSKAGQVTAKSEKRKLELTVEGDLPTLLRKV